ncbi:MAG TPA: helix-turn-helix domain-containing protein [Syntrophorhabdaceae bacterium]|nr:helix-turn-helix domain-containing protein [Syntrophorhabdaceae bacterium]
MTTYRRIETVRKAGEILKYLAGEREPAQAKLIAQAVNLPVGTVMCHLATLEDLGFVTAIGERFKLGMGLALFWARVRASLEADKARTEQDIKSLDTEG